MSAHTPGPWVWDEGRNVLTASDGSKVFDYANYEGMWFAAYDDKRDEANARLIAAAPKLAEALRALLLDNEDYIRINNLCAENNQVLRNARAALAEAGV